LLYDLASDFAQGIHTLEDLYIVKEEYIADDLPSYEHPPVTEVVFGVIFKSLDNFLVPHVGLLWERFRSEFPVCLEMDPLMPVIEGTGGQESAVQINLMDRPPMPRIWLRSRDEEKLLQIQRDRFHFNWKKPSDDGEYPRYRVLAPKFESHLGMLHSFVAENQLGQVEPVQYELTYVNTILAGEGWQGIAAIQSVLPDFTWKTEAKKILPAPEAVHWRMAFPMEGQGRLHVTVRSGKRPNDMKDLLLVELTARGMPKDASPDSMWRWFALARKWIVEGFTELTNPELHKNVWVMRAK
jgi:uncharacterized protein (TIGR04255 family)